MKYQKKYRARARGTRRWHTVTTSYDTEWGCEPSPETTARNAVEDFAEDHGLDDGAIVEIQGVGLFVAKHHVVIDIHAYRWKPGPAKKSARNKKK